ncbi:MAG: hypothetical protein A2W61_00425 [Deltaproteobacteria bacterium RIFCSPLOWO2_01_44_7]|nr:MAG: hypothetical protein A2W61_00425 [Deltaproteobacteria bacterium RIFCSPLOWO2_01_44_7]
MLVEKGETLEFFIEGTRSRSRKLLKPKRGLLKTLQSTGQKFAILPVAISYDRIPEEEAFVRELKGNPKPKMQLRYLTFWLWDTLCGKTALGRIHIACGKPLLLTPQVDVYTLSQQIITQLQTALITTTHHLKCFLKMNPHLGFDLEWLKGAIVARGGKVLESKLEVEEALDPVVEKTMRYHWMHFFSEETDSNDPKLLKLREVLFEAMGWDNAYEQTIDSYHRSDRLSWTTHTQETGH